MNVLVLIGLVLVASGVLLLAVVLPARRRSAGSGTQPRTVADLVRLREEAGGFDGARSTAESATATPTADVATSVAATSPGETSPGETSAAATSTGATPPGDTPAGAAAVAPSAATPTPVGGPDAADASTERALGDPTDSPTAPAPVDRSALVAAEPEGAPESSSTSLPPAASTATATAAATASADTGSVDTAPDADEPAVTEPAPEPAQPATEPTSPEPLPLNLDGDDVPWRRGAWMAVGLAGGRPWPEPHPREPAPLRIVPAAAPHEPVDAPVPPGGAPTDAEPPSPQDESPAPGDGAGSEQAVGPVAPTDPAPAGGGDPSPVAAPAITPVLWDDRDEPSPESVPAGAVPERFAERVPGTGAKPEREASTSTGRPVSGTDSSEWVERAVRRGRPTSDERAAEQAAADLALLRTFGFADPGLGPDAAPVVEMVRTEVGEPSDPTGEAQPVRYRAVRRDGSVVGGAAVTLLDGRGGEVGGGKADADGEGQVIAPASGSYVLVSTAPGHQPGAVAITVAAARMKADVLLARSASVAGTIRGEDGPIAGARVTLVQDGELVDAVDTDGDGTYRIGDLGAGEYGLSVAAAGCQPVAALLDVDEETSVGHDVDLVPASPDTNGDDDPMAGDATSGQR